LEKAVREELSGSGSKLGYRRIHRLLLNRNVVCRREDVRKMVKRLDPEGVSQRRRRRLQRRRYRNPGPNHVWHIDGHDKLGPFGFFIHGAIDGFSRRLIWLEVNSTNKLPEVIASYYLNAAKDMKGIPFQIKADDETEHAIIEPMHVYLSSLDREEVTGAFSIITSPQNQRIEAYWSFLKRDKIGWWRALFEDLADLNLLQTSDPVMVDCLRYCFIAIIRRDLQSVKEDWNNHLISKGRGNKGPTGRPNSMYFLPHLYDAQNFWFQ